MITLNDIERLSHTGLADIFGQQPEYPPQWPEIYGVYDSEKAFEIEEEMKFLGLPQERAPGEPSAVDDMSQRFTTTYFHKYISLGFVITKDAIINNLYPTKFPEQGRALKRSMNQGKEVLAAALVSQGFTNQPQFQGGDGMPLFSTQHPIVGGVYANMLPDATSLSETAIEQSLIGIQKLKDQAGLTCMIQAKKIVVPAARQFDICRILESAFQSATANNAITAIYNLSAIPEGYRVNQFLQSSKDFFFTTNAVSGMKHYVRLGYETNAFADFWTDSVFAKALECYSFGWSDPRGMWGVMGL